MNQHVQRATTELAKQLLQERRFDECVRMAEEVVRTNPDDSLAFSIMGAAFVQLGEKGMAIAAFQNAVVAEPSARAYYNLGTAYERAERLRDAFQQYKLAVEQDANYAPAAQAFDRLKENPEAIAEAPMHVEPSKHMLGGDEEFAY